MWRAKTNIAQKELRPIPKFVNLLRYSSSVGKRVRRSFPNFFHRKNGAKAKTWTRYTLISNNVYPGQGICWFQTTYTPTKKEGGLRPISRYVFLTISPLLDSEKWKSVILEISPSSRFLARFRRSYMPGKCALSTVGKRVWRFGFMIMFTFFLLFFRGGKRVRRAKTNIAQK